MESVSLSLFMEDGFAPLDTLRLSKREIKRLTIMSLDTTPPTVLIPEVAVRAPNLEALHIVVLMARYDEVCPLMSHACMHVCIIFSYSSNDASKRSLHRRPAYRNSRGCDT